MKRNSMNQTKGGGIWTPRNIVIFCVFLFVACTGYLRQKNELETLGQQMREREVKLEQLRRQNELNQDRLARLQSPRYLDAQVKKWNLGLVEPREEQILRLEEAPFVPTVQAPRRQLVRREPDTDDFAVR